MTTITLRQLSKHFSGQPPVLNDLDLTIQSGEFLALLGPSGCGKTTLLRLLAGFEAPSSGQILFDDMPIADARRSLPAERRDVGIVFQSYALWPHLSVAENIAYPLRVKGMSAAQRAHQVDAALAQMHLASHAHKRPEALSGGQRQRVALARCLVQRPRLTLLDEPLASLDVHLRDAMMDALRDFHASLGSTLIYVTHDQHEAMALADRIAVLDAGRLQQVGTPQQLYDAPASEFVANFVGRSRIVPVQTDGHGRARCGTLVFPLVSSQAAYPAGMVRAQIRPQAVHLGSGPANARVVRRRYRGQDHELELALLDAPEVRLLCDHHQAVQVGEAVHVAVQHAWLLPGI